MKLVQSLLARHHGVVKALRSESKNSALLLSSAVTQYRNHDNVFPYRQESNFWYLTACRSPQLALLIRADAKRPILFSAPTDSLHALWEGPVEEPKTIARRIGAELRITKSIEKDIFLALDDVEQIFLDNKPGTLSAALHECLSKLSSFQRGKKPARIALVDEILAPLRLIKDSYELRCMQDAADLVTLALTEVVPLIRPGVFEFEIVAALEYLMKSRGGDVSFPPIVASGPNAAALHYHGARTRLKKGDLLLVDVGAEFDSYASDITRVFPVDGVFSKKQALHYDAVLRAQVAAISKIRNGASMSSLFDAAAKEISCFLRETKIVKTPLATLLKKKAYKDYFPHSIGHSLGLDVHDIGKLRGGVNEKLQTGMVITVEPGIYFQKPKAGFPRSGVRIEDDVYLSKKGPVVLTGAFPKDRASIEGLLSS